MNDHNERKGTRKCQINGGLLQKYEGYLKTTMMQEAKQTNN